MVQISTSLFALLLVVPAFAAPVVFEDLEARDPNFFKSIARGVKKVATPHNIKTAARIASVFFRREDGTELTERDVGELASGLEDLVAREPNFHSFLHKVKKVATPHNIRTVANIVKTFVRRDLDEDTITELVARGLSGEADLEDLLAREPVQEHASHALGHSHHAERKHKRAHKPRRQHHDAETTETNSLKGREFEDDIADLLAREDGEHHSHGHHRIHKAKKAHMPRHHHSAQSEASALQAREFEDEAADLMAREGDEEPHHAHHHTKAPEHAHAHVLSLSRVHSSGHVGKVAHPNHGHHNHLAARDLALEASLDELD